MRPENVDDRVDAARRRSVWVVRCRPSRVGAGRHVGPGTGIDVGCDGGPDDDCVVTRPDGGPGHVDIAADRLFDVTGPFDVGESGHDSVSSGA